MTNTSPNKTALLVDDNRANLLIIQQELLRLGFIVTAVSHPSRVESTIAITEDIDVIFLDLEMPTMDGYQVLENLRKLGMEIPIIAHTVHTDQLPKIRKAGFDGLIAKPLDIDTFPQAVEKLLDGEKIWLTN
jgi:CheY-like chemotaxis protein